MSLINISCLGKSKKIFSLSKLNKKISLLIVSSIFTFTTCRSQTSLYLGYYDFYTTSRNVAFSVGYSIKKNEYIAGIKYHINDPIKWQANIYGRNLNSSNFLQHFGFNGEFRRYLNKNRKKNFNPFLFCQIQITHKTIKDEQWVYYIKDSTWKYETSVNGPYWFWENTIGIGCKAKVFKHFGLFANIGGGLTLIGGTKGNDFLGIATWQFTRLFSGGIVYHLNGNKSEFKKRPNISHKR